MSQIDVSKMKAQDFTKEFKSIVNSLDVARAGTDGVKPVDISFSELVEEKWGLSEDDLFAKVGVNPRIDTMENIFSMPDQSVRWVVPEILRNAITLGMRQAPFYPNLIASDQPIAGLSAIMPYINMSDAAPAKVNEAETIPLGTISYGQKTVNLFKIGKGIKLTDEVRSYVSLDVLGIYLRDFGIQLGYAMDTLALDATINGNKLDGSESAPVIGVATSGTLKYRDILKIWIRGSRMGRNFSSMIGGEDMALDILDLEEFKNRQAGTTHANLNVKTPVPNSSDFYIHPGVPNNSALLIDKRAALIKLTAKQLSLESERIVSNQTSAVYASLTTGFSKMYQDASLILDKSKAFSSFGFPSYMNIDPYLSVILGS
jgi:hypothetical protein